ncbi:MULTISPECIES: hypothetical protein [Streptomyces]|uniref:Uncharacterized protein n=2 Tax=Streptomyces TaxID=1883 RepID=A0A2U9P578_STRAS|nr:hypothetical protein [Streptomyces actuosus]AWT44920.1 hypothetical protein DMT42_23260 [Streptomyces actuosus]MBM4821475.1 hypothetical protein [Streptomyces actuosus]
MTTVDHTPYTFLISANNPVPLSGPVPPHLPPDAETPATIRRTGQRPEEPPLARVVTPRLDRGWSRKAPVPFWIHSGPDDALLCSVHPAGPDSYEVRAADGTPLARVTRHPGRFLPWPRRVRWSADPAGSSGQVTGREGTWWGWLTYVVTSPVWFLWVVGMTLFSFFDGSPDDFTFGRPSRTRWHAPGTGTVLDYRGRRKTCRHDPGHLDSRTAYALAVLRTWSASR